MKNFAIATVFYNKLFNFDHCIKNLIVQKFRKVLITLINFFSEIFFYPWAVPTFLQLKTQSKLPNFWSKASGWKDADFFPCIRTVLVRLFRSVFNIDLSFCSKNSISSSTSWTSCIKFSIDRVPLGHEFLLEISVNKFLPSKSSESKNSKNCY